MAIRVLGEGPPVVLIHGGPGAQGSLRGLAHDLAPDFQVIEHLQPRSDHGPVSVRTAIESLVNEAPPGAVWVGHSWGAMLAMLAAPKANCAGIILVGSGTFDAVSRLVYQDRMAEALGPKGRSRKAALKTALATAPEEEREMIFAELGSLSERAMSPALLPDPWPSELDPAGHEQVWADRMAMGDLTKHLDDPGCRVAMLHGTHDPHPGAEIAAEIRAAGIAVDLQMIEEAGHSPWREPAVRDDFLRRIRSEIKRAFV